MREPPKRTGIPARKRLLETPAAARALLKPSVGARQGVDRWVEGFLSARLGIAPEVGSP